MVWAVISITILSAHKNKSHGTHFYCSLLREIGHLVAIMFVDENDLIHINIDQDQTTEGAHYYL